jgi:hypothetical protein
VAAVLGCRLSAIAVANQKRKEAANYGGLKSGEENAPQRGRATNCQRASAAPRLLLPPETKAA